MSKAEVEALEKVLNRVSLQLEDILKELKNISSLIKSGESTSIQQTKSSLLKSKLRSQIYELCDGTHRVSEIAKFLNKPMPVVSRYLKELEDAGLILPEQDKKGKRYYKVI